MGARQSRTTFGACCPRVTAPQIDEQRGVTREGAVIDPGMRGHEHDGVGIGDRGVKRHALKVEVRQRRDVGVVVAELCAA